MEKKTEEEKRGGHHALRYALASLIGAPCAKTDASPAQNALRNARPLLLLTSSCRFLQGRTR
eukprot:2403084-Pyramimonas_sp.AAC.1